MIPDELRRSMLTGEVYNDLRPELIAAREVTVTLTDEYNRSFGAPSATREAILGRLLDKVGAGVHFEPDLRCEFGFHIRIGDNFYANFDCIMLDGGGITIGNNVLFGPRVAIFTSNHAIDALERQLGACVARPVTIGDNCWLGGNVTVNPGVTIGPGTVVGSASVVTKSLPANVVAAGVPAVVLREITEADRTGFQP